MATKLLSMDTSTSATGCTIWVDGKYSGYSLLETDKKIKGDEKLDQMIKLVYQYIDKETPKIVVVEEAVVVRNPQVQRMLTELLGSIRGKCVSQDIEFHALRPTEWRKQITDFYGIKPKGRKREDLKAWSLNIVNNTMGIETDSNDISDSVLVGLGYIQMCKE